MNKILTGDCLKRLRTLKDCSVDSLVCDPPSSIGFMGLHWDSDKGGRDQWIAWLAEVMRECYRVMKPGAHGFVWALPRTSHWTATALEDAGFEVRDVITHLFGSGFPKSMCVSKAIDKRSGAKRKYFEVPRKGGPGGKSDKIRQISGDRKSGIGLSSHPVTGAAKQWQGFGTNLKPASEHWVLIRKPLAAKSIADNVLTYGTGAINVDASRIGLPPRSPGFKNPTSKGLFKQKSNAALVGVQVPTGRFPSNLLLSHHSACIQVGMKRAWQCDESCPVKEIDRQSIAGGMHSAGKARPAKRLAGAKGLFSLPGDGHRIGDSGGASRFFKTFQPEVKRAKRR